MEPGLSRPARAVNAIGAALMRMRLVRKGFAAERLIARARRATGMDDLGEDLLGDVREGLDVLCASLTDDANLSFMGQMFVNQYVSTALATRLALVDALRRGASAPASLDRMLVIVGLPRTGTTLLQRMLAVNPDARYLPTWLLLEPWPAPDRHEWLHGGARLARCRRRLGVQTRLMPGIARKHELVASMAEEELVLMNGTFRAMDHWVRAPVFGYVDWMLEQDGADIYRYLRSLLALYQPGIPGTHWVLKSPAHMLHLDHLLAIWPEARIIHTHRAPETALPSCHSLALSLHTAVSRRVDVPRMVATQTRLFSTAATRAMHARDRAGPERFFDVDYRDLVADPVAVARAIHERFDIAWPDGHDDRLRAWLSDNRRGKHGAHVYSAADFGQSEDEIREVFADYTRRYLPDRA